MLISHWLKSLRNRLHRAAPSRVSQKRRKQRIALKNLNASVESLEERVLLAATGPRLVAITPNTGVFDPAKGFQDGEVLDTAPREMMFRFSEGQVIDANTLRGIDIVRSGFDDVFLVDMNGNSVDNNPNFSGQVFDDSVPVDIGSIQIGQRPNEVIVRFANTLVDDTYQIRLLGTGNHPLRNETGVAFNDGEDQTFSFEVDRGAQIEAVVHQPVLRNQKLTVDDVSQLSDGATFTVQAGGAPLTFEFENLDAMPPDGLSDPNHIQISYHGDSDSEADIAFNIAQALTAQKSSLGPAFGLTATEVGSSVVIKGDSFSPVVTPGNMAVDALSVHDADLVQRQNMINVYFNANDPLDPASAQSPAFYRLIRTDGTVLLPTSVIYNADAAVATLVFNDPNSPTTPTPLDVGTYNLRIGESFESNNRITTDPLMPSTGEPINLGTRNSNTTLIRDAFIGGNPNSTSLDPNDVDLYRFKLLNPGDLTLSVITANGLNAHVRLFDADGLPVSMGAADFDTVNATPLVVSGLGPGVYYVGISSQGNESYNPLDGTGSVGGMTVGSYRMQLTTSALAPLVDSGSGNNSIATAQALSPTSFTRLDNAIVTRSTEIPHVTVIGNGDGVNDDYFSFQAKAGDQGTFDIDGADFDSKLFLYDQNGILLAENDNRAADPGSTTLFDSFLQYNFDADGTYYLRVTRVTGVSNGLTSVDAPNGNYRLNVSVGGNNSSFDTATQLGNLGTAGQDVTNVGIDPEIDVTLPPEPGGNDEPGHRDIPLTSDTPEGGGGQNHLTNSNQGQTNAGPNNGRGVDPFAPNGIRTIAYNFQSFYGVDPSGNELFNNITDDQKERTREIFELFSLYSGVQFVEAANIAEAQAMGAQFDDILTIVTGDLRALVPGAPTGPGNVEGLSGDDSDTGGVGLVAIMDEGENFTPQQNQYGGKWFRIAMNEIGRLLGLNEALDLNAIMGSGANGGLGTEPTNPLTVEPVFPGNDDIVHLRRLFRRDSIDIDMYKFDVAEAGLVTIETLAERLETASQLDTVLTLYKEVTTADGVVRQEIARNDNYYGNDSLISLRLDPGTYYVGVSSVGNENYDPVVLDSGSNGRSDGAYELRLDMLPDATSSIVDVDSTPQPDGTIRPATALDGNGDGTPGGTFDYSFQVGNTIFVDKSGINNITKPLGSIENPYAEIDLALAEAQARRNGTSPNAVTGDNIPVIVRILGNSGTDGQLATPADNHAYLLGLDDNLGNRGALVDGKTFDVPKDVTVVIDAGANLKLQDVNIDVGTSAVAVDRSGGAVQVLGTTQNDVILTSYHDDSVGGDSDGVHPGATPGDWGGIVYRSDSDYDFEYNVTKTNPGIPTGPSNTKIRFNDFTFTGFPVEGNEAKFTITAVANLASVNEFLTVTIGTGGSNPITQQLFVNDGANPDGFALGDVPVPLVATITVTREQLRDLVAADGTITVHFDTSPDVDNLLFNERLSVNLNASSAVPMFLDIVNHATITYGGGPVVVNSAKQDFDAIHLFDSRPTITFNTITQSARAAISGNPNSFNDTFEDPRRYDHNLDRLGPNIHGNSITDNSTNGVRIRTQLQGGVPLETLTVPARFASTDVVYVITENLQIEGGAGGLAINQNIDPDLTGDDVIAKRPSGRLRIDPGVIVKLSGSRIETELGSSNLIAEGTSTDPIIFTSLNDDSYGAGGTFDTNNDSQPPQGQSNLNTVGGGGTNNAIAGGASTQAFGAESGGGESGTVPQDVIDAAMESFQGSDGVGKDGPLARLGWQLNVLYQEYQAYLAGGSVGEFHSNQPVIQTSGTNALVDLSAGTGSVNNLARAIKRLGFTILAQAGPVITTLIPIAQLDELVTMSEAPVIQPVYASKTNVGITTSQGDIAMNSDDARNTFGVDGSGVTVGVLSDSFDTSGVGSYLTDQTTNDLPGPNNTQGRTTPVTVLQDSPNGTDEGRAMLQLVHDVAPGADLQFATANPSQAAFANNIRALDAAGSDVIVDDVIYYAEPMFQDGLVAQAVDSVAANGKSYFSAAGNNDRQSYESAFVDSGVAGPSGGELHDFDTSAGVDSQQQYTIQPGASVIFVLQWDQPFGSLGGAASQSDVDLLIFDSAGNVITSISSINNNIGGDALELTGFANNSATPQTFSVGFELVSGPAPGKLKYVEFDQGGVSVDEYATDSPTSYGHANAQGAEAVGAAAYFNTPEFGVSPPQLDPYSSAGGIDILFDTDGTRLGSPSVRQTPDIVGPDGGNTSFFGQDIPTDSDSFPNFFGTSAAAPHAAAVAALMLDAAGGAGTLSPNSIYNIMQNTATDMDVSGVDDNSGYGFIDAFQAVQTAEVSGDQPPPLVLGQQPKAGDWGGLVFQAASSGNLDYVKVRYAGGLTPIAGGFASFNPVEITQAEVRISNSLFEENESGVNNLTTNTNRNGRGENSEATVFIRGAQPTIVTNIFQNNNGNVISVDANSLNSELNPDLGRATGPLFTRPFFGSEEDDVTTEYANNVGPLVRNNRMDNNTTNGMEVRGGILTTEGVWDDVDIVHVVRDEIIVDNLHTFGGLRLQSNARESLVVKLSGANAGFRAAGTIDPVTGATLEGLDITDRIGGTLQIVGTPGRPVVLTSITDNTVGAGFTPDGVPLLVTTGGGARNGVVIGPEVNNGTLIDNDVVPGTEGHFDFQARTGGDSFNSNAIVQGVNSLVNSNFLFEYTNYVDVGANGGALDLGTTNVTQAATLIAPDTVQSAGSFAGANGTVNWTVTQSIDNGTGLLKSVLTFDSVAGLGNLRYINYLDQDVLGISDDILQPTGTPGAADFRLFTRDSAEQVGFAQYGEFQSGPDLANATYDGYAADRFFDLGSAILGGGTTYSINGNINTTNLPPMVDPNLGTIYGPNDVTSAMAWSVNPTATSATITAYLELATPSGTLGGSPGDWRGIVLDKNSNDRNVAVVNEIERATRADNDANSIPDNAEFIGTLAPSQASADDNRRAGFEVHGFINTDNSQDQDVYSFTANAGNEVWFDIDRTSGSLDTVLQLVDINGNVIASSDNSQVEQSNPDLFGGIGLPMIKDERLGGDFYTTNPKDAGMRVILPGAFAGESNTYFIRVRSKGAGDSTSTAVDGLTSGEYQLQIRLRQTDEKPGSVVTYSDIRYADVGIQVNGLPYHSPLTGEASESANDTAGNDVNGSLTTADLLGNLLQSDQNTLSVSGNLSNPNGDDLDFYKFTIGYADIQRIPGFNNNTVQPTSTIFDIDYADGLARGDTSLYIFNAAGQLILSSTNSNVANDRPGPLQGNNLNDTSRGSVGGLDPYIGAQELPEGTYYAVVTAKANIATALSQFTDPNSVAKLTRLQPVNSITRIAEDHIGSQGGMTAQDPNTLTRLVDTSNPNYDTSNPLVTRPTSSVVPWNLGDVSLVVSREVSPGSDQTQLYTVDPFTGEFQTLIGTAGRDVRDIDIYRRTEKSTDADGNIVAFSARNGVGDDAVTGNFIRYSSGDASQISSVDDGIITYIDDGAGNPIIPRNGAGVGVDFNAIAYTNGTINANGARLDNGTSLTGATTRILAVGDRGDHLIDNILYAFLPNGTQINSIIPGHPADKNPNIPVPPSPGPPPTSGSAGTNKVEIAILDTGNPRGGLIIPDPTDDVTFARTVQDGDRIAVSTGGFGGGTTFEMDSGPQMTVNVDQSAGQFIQDGDTITLDGNVYEFETGVGFDLKYDSNGGSGAGMITEGTTFTITADPGTGTAVTVTFEFDRDNSVTAGNQRVDISGAATASQVVTAIKNAIMSNPLLAGTVTATSFVDGGGPVGMQDIRISLESTVNNNVLDATVSGDPQITLTGALGVTAANSIPVEEYYTTDQVGEAIASVVNGIPLPTQPNGYELGRANFPTFTAFTSPIVTARAGVLTDDGTTGGVSGTNIEVDFFADDTASSLAMKIRDAINLQFPTTPVPAFVTSSGGTSVVQLITNSGLTFSTFGTDNPPFAIATGGPPGGDVTGMAPTAGSMWAVSDNGGLYKMHLSDNDASLEYVTTATDLVGIQFEGLTAGPANTEGGIYSDVLFGVDNNGVLYAFDTTGKLLPVFVDGQSSIQLRDQNGDPLGSTFQFTNGLSFSNLDFNLWHDTTDRGGPDLAFTNEPTTNAADNTYGNLADGAHGTVETDPFSLVGYSAADQPTMYMTYFLDTENTAHDVARVYVGTSDGTWTAVSTNQGTASEMFDNTNSERQIRVDLSPWAGLSDLQLRYEFSTAGSLNIGNIMTGGTELRALNGDTLRDGDTFRIDNRTFEFDLGYTVVLPAGSQVIDGDTVRVDTPNGSVTFEFDNDGTLNDPANRAVEYSVTDSAVAIATAFREAVTLAAFGITAIQNGQRVNLVDKAGSISTPDINEVEGNDTIATAQNLENYTFTVDSDNQIANSTVIPHVTINGTGDGTFDYYSFQAGQEQDVTNRSQE